MNRLSFELVVDVKKEFKNISKHKQKLMPVIYSDINLLINGLPLDNHEVFDVNEFFDSLIKEGKYPMFTCTCGVFGCGGYYVDVLHKGNSIIWITEQTPFYDKFIESSNKFTFSWRNIIDFTEQLTDKLNGLNNLMINNGYEGRYNIEKYADYIEKLRKIHL